MNLSHLHNNNIDSDLEILNNDDTCLNFDNSNDKLPEIRISNNGFLFDTPTTLGPQDDSKIKLLLPEFDKKFLNQIHYIIDNLDNKNKFCIFFFLQ